MFVWQYYGSKKLYWIKVKDCQTDDECASQFPNAPICDKTGRCIPLLSMINPPTIFNNSDPCKKLYGQDFAYSKKLKACMIPKCNPLDETKSCPLPSKCVQGKIMQIISNKDKKLTSAILGCCLIEKGTANYCKDTSECPSQKSLCHKVIDNKY